MPVVCKCGCDRETHRRGTELYRELRACKKEGCFCYKYRPVFIQ